MVGVRRRRVAKHRSAPTQGDPARPHAFSANHGNLNFEKTTMRRIYIVCALCLTALSTCAWAAAPVARTAQTDRHDTRPAGRRHARRTHTQAKARTTVRISATGFPRAIRAGEQLTRDTLAGTGNVFLFGDQAIEGRDDYNPAGVAEAFPFKDSTTGTAQAISVYVDNYNSASTLVAGLYTNSNGHPGSLMAQARISPSAGAWNNVTFTGTHVSSGRKYWIAVLGPAGTLHIRDRAYGLCWGITSYQTGLGALPQSWTSGRRWNDCPISAYVSGRAGALFEAPVNTSVPSITGLPYRGSTLTTSTGSWLGSPTTYTYAWEDCDSAGSNCTQIARARLSSISSYTLTHGDVAHTIRFVVTGSNSSGSASAVSAATASVTGQPQASVMPVIGGSGTPGATLSATTGTWSGNPTSYYYQWLRCDPPGANCASIAGASGRTYALQDTDVGSSIQVAVTAANAAGSATATSSPKAQVAVASASPIVYTGPPTLTGIATLSATADMTIIGDTTAAVTWLLDGKPIGTDSSGSSGSYSFQYNTAQTAQGTHNLTVQAFGNDGRTLTSDSTPVTVGAGPVATSGDPTASNAIVHLSGIHGGVTIGADTTVYGDGPRSTIINGNVTLAPNAAVENLTINGSIKAYAAKNALLQNVTVNPSTSGMSIINSPGLSVQESTFNGSDTSCAVSYAQSIGTNCSTRYVGISDLGESGSANMVIAYNTVTNFGGDDLSFDTPPAVVSGDCSGSPPSSSCTLVSIPTGLQNILILGNALTNARGPFDNGTEARNLLVSGDGGHVFYNTATNATTTNIEPFRDAKRMDFAFNNVSGSQYGVCFYLEHFTDYTTFNNNVTGRGCSTAFNVEWFAHDAPRGSENDRFMNNDITYTSSGIFADAGTSGMVVSPTNTFHGPLPAVTLQGSTNGTIAGNDACTTETGLIQSVYSNAGFDPTGNTTLGTNTITGSC